MYKYTCKKVELLRCLAQSTASDRLKACSQSDARPRVAFIRETHTFITKNSQGFLDDLTQERNAGERKDGIQVNPSIVLRFYKCRREDDATKHIV